MNFLGNAAAAPGLSCDSSSCEAMAVEYGIVSLLCQYKSLAALFIPRFGSEILLSTACLLVGPMH